MPPNLGPLGSRVFRLTRVRRAGGSGRVCQHDRGLFADGTALPILVLVYAPLLQLFAGICKSQEPVGVCAVIRQGKRPRLQLALSIPMPIGGVPSVAPVVEIQLSVSADMADARRPVMIDSWRSTRWLARCARSFSSSSVVCSRFCQQEHRSRGESGRSATRTSL